VPTLLSLVGHDTALDERAKPAGYPRDGARISVLPSTIYRGWVKLKNSDVRGGNIASAQRFDRLPRYQGRGLDDYYIGLLARAYDISGEIEEALTRLREALQIVERTRERWLDEELYRHKG
jgi:hypothetical protein